MFIYSGASIGSVVMWVNISFQPDEEQEGTHLLRFPDPGWLTSSSLEKRLPQLSRHVRVTRASIVPKHQLWVILVNIHSLLIWPELSQIPSYLSKTATDLSSCCLLHSIMQWQKNVLGTAKRVVVSLLLIFFFLTDKYQNLDSYKVNGAQLSPGYPSAIWPLLFQPQREKLQFETVAGPKTMLVCRRPGPAGKQVHVYL